MNGKEFYKNNKLLALNLLKEEQKIKSIKYNPEENPLDWKNLLIWLSKETSKTNSYKTPSFKDILNCENPEKRLIEAALDFINFKNS